MVIIGFSARGTLFRSELWVFRGRLSSAPGSADFYAVTFAEPVDALYANRLVSAESRDMRKYECMNIHIFANADVWIGWKAADEVFGYTQTSSSCLTNEFK